MKNVENYLKRLLYVDSEIKCRFKIGVFVILATKIGVFVIFLLLLLLCFELYAFIILTSTLVLGINYFVVMTRPLHQIQIW